MAGRELQRKKLEQEKKDREELKNRLSAPQHIVYNRFEEHVRVEDFKQSEKTAEDFTYDRLMKLDTLYGRIQMGYHPGRDQAFLYANIKTSIYDSAPYAFQRSYMEIRGMKELKTGAYANQNLAWSSRRIANSSVILYKAQNKPWDESSVRPYLGRANLGALRKTMPFLLRGEEQERRLGLLTEQAERKAQIQEILSGRETKKEYGQKNTAVASLRAEQYAAEKQMEDLEALFSKKQLMSINFFHRINMAFDLQKIKMFDYYRTIRMQRSLKAENAAAAEDASGERNKKKDSKTTKAEG
ncbi:MAG TPA: hypothetical protein PKY19_04955 [Oscillospiraceae bacterium]|nr:hypothetical protein [Oscillospiraceae bacterium]